MITLADLIRRHAPRIEVRNAPRPASQEQTARELEEWALACERDWLHAMMAPGARLALRIEAKARAREQEEKS